MTRESKLALMIAVTLILLVGVLLSDHLSGATVAEFDEPAPADRASSPVAVLPGVADPINSLVVRTEPTRADEDLDAGAFGGGEPDLLGGGPVVISQAGQSPERSILGQALDGVGTGVAGAVGRLRASDPPELIIWGETFEPIDTRSVTLPPRDPRGDRPVKPVPDDGGTGSNTAGSNAAGSDSAGSDAARSEPDRSRPSQPEPARAWRTHTVASGDNLYRLAAKHLGDGERWPELQRLNRDVLGDGTELQIGQVIKIAPAPSGQATPAARATRTAPAPSLVPREYVVLKGDMLSEISLKLLGTTRRMKEIVELNGLKDPDDIRVGQTLKIPAR